MSILPTDEAGTMPDDAPPAAAAPAPGPGLQPVPGPTAGLAAVPAAEFVAAIRSHIHPDYSGRTIDGPVKLEGLDYPAKLVIRDATFSGFVDLGDSRFGHSLDLSGCTFQQSVCFVGSRIRGNLVLNDARISRGDRSEEPADFELIRVEGNLAASRLRSELGLNCRRASIAGDFEFLGSNVESGGLNLSYADIAGDIFGQSSGEVRTEIDGGINGIGVKVRGQVAFNGSRIGGVLNLQSAEVRGDIVCQSLEMGRRIEVAGAFSLAGAKVHGQVALCGAQLKDDLNVQSAEVRGGVFCQSQEGGHRTEVEGDVSLSGTKVGGQVTFSGAKIGGKLSCQDLVVDGSFFCRPSADGRRTEVKRRVNLEGSKIGFIALDGGMSPGEQWRLVQADFRKLVIIDRLPPRIGAEVTEPGAGWVARARSGLRRRLGLGLGAGAIDAEGFQFKQIVLPTVPYFGKQVDDYEGYLGSLTTFQKSSYRYLERWYRNQGEDEKANHVYRIMRREDLKVGQPIRRGLMMVFIPLDWALRVANRALLDLLMGYGTQTKRLGWLLILSLGLTTALFARPKAVERRSVATVADVKTQIDDRRTTEVGASKIPPLAIPLVGDRTPRPNAPSRLHPDPALGQWSGLHAFWLALRMHTPLVSIMASDDWEPSTLPIRTFDRDWPSRATYQHVAAGVSSACLVAVPLFLAGISGLIKKQQ